MARPSWLPRTNPRSPALVALLVLMVPTLLAGCVGPEGPTLGASGTVTVPELRAGFVAEYQGEGVVVDAAHGTYLTTLLSPTGNYPRPYELLPEHTLRVRSDATPVTAMDAAGEPREVIRVILEDVAPDGTTVRLVEQHLDARTLATVSTTASHVVGRGQASFALVKWNHTVRGLPLDLDLLHGQRLAPGTSVQAAGTPVQVDGSADGVEAHLNTPARKDVELVLRYRDDVPVPVHHEAHDPRGDGARLTLSKFTQGTGDVLPTGATRDEATPYSARAWTEPAPPEERTDYLPLGLATALDTARDQVPRVDAYLREHPDARVSYAAHNTTCRRDDPAHLAGGRCHRWLITLDHGTDETVTVDVEHRSLIPDGPLVASRTHAREAAPPSAEVPWSDNRPRRVPTDVLVALSQSVLDRPADHIRYTPHGGEVELAYPESSADTRNEFMVPALHVDPGTGLATSFFGPPAWTRGR